MRSVVQSQSDSCPMLVGSLACLDFLKEHIMDGIGVATSNDINLHHTEGFFFAMQVRKMTFSKSETIFWIYISLC